MNALKQDNWDHGAPERTGEIITGIDDMITEATEEFLSDLAQRCSNLSLEGNDSIRSTCPNQTVDLGEAEEHVLNYTKISVLSVIIILTVIGNICVILAIFCRQMKMTRMYYFILHLSLADLLTAFFTLLPELIWTFTWPNFYGGAFVCKAIKFLQMIGPYLSSYVLIMTAIDRFQAICHPLSNCTWTPKRSNVMIAVAWIISVILCVPQILIFHGTDDACSAYFAPSWGLKTYVTWFAFSNFFIPFVVLVYCYGRICHAIWANFNSKTNHRALEGRGQSGSRTQSRQEPSRWQRASRALRGGKKRARSSRKPERIRLRWKSSKPSGGAMFSENVTADEWDSGQTKIVIEPPSSSPIRNPASAGQSTTTTKGAKTMTTTSFMAKSRRRSSSPDSSPSPPLGRSKRAINPRSHSIRGISRAKMKTVKLTVVVIMGYIICSTPFICVQLWATWGRPSHAVMQSITWLFWLLTLNSVVNPWIYMFFNVNLVEALCRACCAYQTPFPRNNVANGIGLRHREAKSAKDTAPQRNYSQSITGIVTLNGSQDITMRSRSNTNGSHTSLTLLSNPSVVRLSDSRDSPASSNSSKVTFDMSKGQATSWASKSGAPSHMELDGNKTEAGRISVKSLRAMKWASAAASTSLVALPVQVLIDMVRVQTRSSTILVWSTDIVALDTITKKSEIVTKSWSSTVLCAIIGSRLGEIRRKDFIVGTRSNGLSLG
eukprot:snap_masked-scaffold348_size200312-processed-gene-1.4 protein:Tk10910 transcript:snap_masked-scaffold348_size200312-processed-gene-1.4-mRNA-1 annotation:"vasopressin v1a"